MRVSVEAEKAGIPSATDVCSTFVQQAQLIAKMAGVPGARVAEYPGHTEVHSPEERNRHVEEVIVPQVIKALTEPLKEASQAGVEEPDRETLYSAAPLMK